MRDLQEYTHQLTFLPIKVFNLKNKNIKIKLEGSSLAKWLD